MAEIAFTLNGKPTAVDTDGTRMLLWVLRSDLGLTGTKHGCGIGACGSCTVLVDGEPVCSCRMPLADIQGKEVITIEGLASEDGLHPIQQAFADNDALQCGFCAPGMIMAAYGLLLANPRPTRADIVEHMEGNLCRCGAHVRIIQAIEVAAERMGG